MEKSDAYLMESNEEAFRLELKTDVEAVRKQALWCGVKEGLRVLDLGCGPGKTTAILHGMVAPTGSVVGADYSAERIAYAKEHYGGKPGIEFVRCNLTKPLEGLGSFDLIWMRFVLEYFRKESPEIVGRLRTLLKPGGYLCLIDLDYNCLGHYGMPEPMNALLPKLMACLDEEFNFDTYAGRKLYSYLYDQGYENIEAELMAHHLIYGRARQVDVFNWLKKVQIGTEKMQGLFQDYPGGADTFMEDFKKFFLDPRRFTYTPLILCKGMRPATL
jgi:ubiquinone/menaquinone biosynthesis C-methylase UbiE